MIICIFDKATCLNQNDNTDNKKKKNNQQRVSTLFIHTLIIYLDYWGVEVLCQSQ